MSKSFATFLIVLLSVVLLSITGLFVYLLNVSDKIDFSNIFNLTSSYSENLVDSKIVESADEIFVDSKNCDVFFESSLDNQIVVELYSDNVDDYSISDDNNKLNVKMYVKSNGFNMKGSKILIKLPESYSNNVKVNSLVGDVHVEKFDNLKLDVVSSVGDVKVDSVDVANVKISTGDLKVNKCNKITSNITTGDVKISNASDIKSKVKTGDIKIVKVTDKLDLDVKVGDVKIENASIKNDSNISIETGDVKISKITGVYVDAESNVGDVKIKNNDRKAEFTLKIKSNVGDVKVNYND